MRSGDEWLSAGIATGRQARRERNLLALMETMTSKYLTTMKKYAFAEGLGVTAAGSKNYWRDHVELALFLSKLTDAEKAYVRADLLESDIPDESYDSIRAVFTLAQEQGMDLDNFATKLQITAALSLNSASVSLEPQALAAAGFWSGLAEAGTKWISKVRRTVRTTSTGLDGYITLGALRISGVPYKRWVTRHDDDVRLSHQRLDGMTIPVDQAFISGSSALAYPGDKAGDYDETVNCRCVMVGVLRGE